LRDVVVTALFRRALVTAEGAVVLLSRGLLEPAISQLRTILDIELSLKLIKADATGKMAKRLAASHYLIYQKHGEHLLTSPLARAEMDENGGRGSELIEIAKSYARFLKDPTFDDIRAELTVGRYWHGFDRPRDAFASVGAESDYLMTYGSATWFVHAANVEHDFAEHEADELRMKPLVHRDPALVQVHLGMVVLKLLSVMGIYIEERGYPTSEPFDAPSAVKVGGGATQHVNAFEALQGLAASAFPTLDEWRQATDVRRTPRHDE